MTGKLHGPRLSSPGHRPAPYPESESYAGPGYLGRVRPPRRPAGPAVRVYRWRAG